YLVSIFYVFYQLYIVLFFFFFFSSRRRHTRWPRDWSSDVCSSDLFSTLVAGPCSDENRYCCGTGRASSEDCAPLPPRTVSSKIWAWPPSAVTCRSPSVPLISQSRFVPRERPPR